VQLRPFQTRSAHYLQRHLAIGGLYADSPSVNLGIALHCVFDLIFDFNPGDLRLQRDAVGYAPYT